jgi:hypothetical protein
MSLRDADEERKNGSTGKDKGVHKEASGKSLKGDERKKFLSTCLSNYDDHLSGMYPPLFFIFQFSHSLLKEGFPANTQLSHHQKISDDLKRESLGRTRLA